MSTDAAGKIHGGDGKFTGAVSSASTVSLGAPQAVDLGGASFAKEFQDWHQVLADWEDAGRPGFGPASDALDDATARVLVNGITGQFPDAEFVRIEPDPSGRSDEARVTDVLDADCQSLVTSADVADLDDWSAQHGHPKDLVQAFTVGGNLSYNDGEWPYRLGQCDDPDECVLLDVQKVLDTGTPAAREEVARSVARDARRAAETAARSADRHTGRAMTARIRQDCPGAAYADLSWESGSGWRLDRVTDEHQLRLNVPDGSTAITDARQLVGSEWAPPEQISHGAYGRKSVRLHLTGTDH